MTVAAAPSVSSPPRRRPIGRVIAVASGKGGVGKTFLSTGLADALGRSGRRVLLVDGDFGLANIDVQLGLAPLADLASVIAGRIEVEEAVAAVRGGAVAGGFDVLPGRSGSGSLGGLGEAEGARLLGGLTALSLSYDIVLIDLAAGVEPVTLRLAADADDAVMVVQDEPTSITDAYAFVKQLRLRRDDASPRILVNAAESATAGRRAYDMLAKTCARFLGFSPDLLGVVRRDARVKEAIRAQELVSIRAPQSPAVADIAAAAAALNASPEQKPLPAPSFT